MLTPADPHQGAMLIRDFAHDRQPQTGAVEIFTFGIAAEHAIEALKHQLAPAGIDTGGARCAGESGAM